MDQIAELWPGWETKRVIGKGSYGVVYEIERNVFGHKEQAALKVISVPQSDEEYEELQTRGYDNESITKHFEGCLQDIVREYNLMADMKGCVNIVYCDDIKYVQRDNGIGWQIFIKMELLSPLNKVLGKNVILPDEKVIRLGIDICNALSFCEKRKILHRDIKPQNIFVGPDGTFKLGDFGVAKAVEHTAGLTMVGTYNYMAPETFIGNRPYDAKVDQYSLGLVLYWLLNEYCLPFIPLPPMIPTGAEEEEGRRRRYSGEPVPMPKHGCRELQEIVLKACAFSPEDRYSSATEMQRALERLQLKLQAGEILKEEGNRTIIKPVVSPVKPIVTRMPEREAPKSADEQKTVLKRPAQQPIPRFCRYCGKPTDSTGKCLACGPKSVPVAPVESEVSPAGKKSKKPVLFAALGGVTVAAAVLLAVLLSGKEPIPPVEEPPAVIQEATDSVENNKKTNSEAEQSPPKASAQAEPAVPSKSAEEQSYEEAEAMLASGRIISAYNIFQELGSYRGSASRAASIKTEYPVCFTSVGSYVEFGSYEQDGKSGKEPIEWLVLEKGDDYVLLISRYALANRLFHETKETVTWEGSDLRRWLNNTFYNDAFSTEQQALIAESSVITSGTTTNDKAYLLSVAEAESYFGSNDARGCKPTKAVTNSGAVTGNNGNIWWWLRSSGKNGTSAAGVYSRGVIDYDGDTVNYLSKKTGKAPNGVRPVIRINID